MNKKYLIIDSRPYGLYSIFLHTIDNIKWAHDNGYIPVVRWGPGRRDPNRGRLGAAAASAAGTPELVVDKNNFLKPDTPGSLNNTIGLKHCQCLYWSEEGWDGSNNVWEYYYEPLNEITVEQAENSDHDVSDIFMVGELNFEPGNKFLIGNIHSYEPLVLWNLLGTTFEKTHRQSVYEVIQQNVRVKQKILEKVDTFYDKYFTDDVLAVHVRGTDKKLEYPHKALPLVAYLDAIEERLAIKDTKVFVASDNNEAIAEMIKKFGRERMIVAPAVRMNKYFSPDPICLTSATGPKHGEECLMESILLSRCNHLICTDSNVAAGALYMNPNSTVTYLNRIYGK
jgi:hypothetical protein